MGKKNQSNHIKSNQVHPPLSKEKRVDEQGNDGRRFWLKDGETTMRFVPELLTENQCKIIINHINSDLISFNKKPLPRSRYLITK